MRFRIVLMLSLIGMLSLFAFFPGALVFAWDLAQGTSPSPSAVNRIEYLHERAEAGDAYSALELGKLHLWGPESSFPQGITRDSLTGVSLIERAMEQGFSDAGVFWVVFVDRTPESARKAAQAGSPWALTFLATEYALSFCEDGELRTEDMAAFWDDYAPLMDVEKQARFVPISKREKFRAGYQEEYDRLLEGSLHRAPEHFDELCAVKEEIIQGFFGPNYTAESGSVRFAKPGMATP